MLIEKHRRLHLGFKYSLERYELEPVQLDGVLRNAFLREELDNLKPLITLQLDDLTHFLVVDECAVTSKLLCETVGARKV